MINMRNRFGIVFIGLLCLVVAACSGEDVSTGENQNQDPNGADVGDVGDGDADDVGDGDTDDAGDGDTDDVGEEPDVDDAGDDEEELVFEDVDPVDCSFPSDDPDCADGDFGPASLFTRIHLVEDDSCCADFTGDGEEDNLLGSVMGALSGVDGFEDINANIAHAISTGDLMYLLETKNWVHPGWDSNLDLYIHGAGSSDHFMSENLAGEGSAYLENWSMISGTDQRRYGFDEAYVHDGVLHASGGSFQIRFPGLIDSIDARMEKVSLQANVVQNPEPDLAAGGGFFLREGRFAGAIMRDALFETMNEAAIDCECMGDDVVLYFYEPGGDRWGCGLKEEDVQACVGGTQECVALANQSLCDNLALFSGAADVEVDGERAFSVGAYMEGVSIEIRGVEEDD